MPLPGGTKFGPYEIVDLIGSGGMGEVYRGRDSRLGRDVAVKVLPASVAQDTDRLRRFEQEARATGLLNHPNILAVYDIGTNDGVPYLVSELLEGETLRSKLQEGPLPQRKAVEYAVQITQGLSAAHEKGIVHRDLKPENIFITKDDRVKILDFGLAKLLQTNEESPDRSKLATIQKQTESGIVLGTVGYMSPEQVRGKQTDNRSDIFAFGAILYEMLTGVRPFRGDSAVETMNAILKEDPPDITESKPDLSPTLDHVIRRCLEKNPDMRFHSASDLGFALKELSGVSSRSNTKLTTATPAITTRNWRLPVAIVLAAMILAAAILAVKYRSRPTAQAMERALSFQRLTFRRGNVLHARFAPDGKTVVYGATWEGQPSEIFLANPGNPESRPLNIQKADLLSVNSAGEMAILERRGLLLSTLGTGTLAIASLTGGGALREILENVFEAAWLPDNTGLAVMRFREGKSSIEFPIGNKVFETTDNMSSLRVTPSGDLASFIHFGPNGPSIETVDRSGHRKTMISGLQACDDASWSRDGKTLFTTAAINGRYGIYQIDVAGKIQSFTPMMNHMIVHDVAPDGTLLLEQELTQLGIRVSLAGEQRERDLSWLDGSVLNSISVDGSKILFTETRQGAGKQTSIYLRSTDGSPAIRLGSGHANDLSPDQKWILATPEANSGDVMLIPTGPGVPRSITPPKWKCLGAGFFQNDQDIGIYCAEPNHQNRLYRLDLNTGKTEPLTPPGELDTIAAAQDHQHFLAKINGTLAVYPPDHTNYPFLPGLTPEDKILLVWNDDGVYTWNPDEFPAHIYRIDAKTGKREVWKEIAPDDPSVIRIDNLSLTPDTRSYAYQYIRVLSSDLYFMTH